LHSRQRGRFAGGWLAGEFDTNTGRVRGIAATVEIILPIAAVALGMAIFALVLYFSVAA